MANTRTNPFQKVVTKSTNKNQPELDRLAKQNAGSILQNKKGSGLQNLSREQKIAQQTGLRTSIATPTIRPSQAGITQLLREDFSIPAGSTKGTTLGDIRRKELTRRPELQGSTAPAKSVLEPTGAQKLTKFKTAAEAVSARTGDAAGKSSAFAGADKRRGGTTEGAGMTGAQQKFPQLFSGTPPESTGDPIQDALANAQFERNQFQRAFEESVKATGATSQKVSEQERVGKREALAQKFDQDMQTQEQNILALEEKAKEQPLTQPEQLQLEDAQRELERLQAQQFEGPPEEITPPKEDVGITAPSPKKKEAKPTPEQDFTTQLAGLLSQLGLGLDTSSQLKLDSLQKTAADPTIPTTSNDILDKYAEIEMQQRERDQAKIDRKKAEIERDKQAGRDQADAQKEATENERDELISEAEEAKDERITAAKRRLKGRLEYDDEGNLTADSVALLDKIEAEAEKDFNKTKASYIKRADSQLGQIESNFIKLSNGLDDQATTLEDSIITQQGIRENNFNQMVFKSELDQQQKLEQMQLEQELNQQQVGVPKPDVRKVDGNLVQVMPDGTTKVVFGGKDLNEANDLSFEEGEDLLTLLNMMGGTKMSDKEGIRIAEQYRRGLKIGLDLDTQAKRLAGFKNIPEVYGGIAEVLYNSILGEDTDFKQKNDVSRLLRGGTDRTALMAISSVERIKMPEDSDFSQERTESILSEANKALDLIEEVGEEFMGAIDSRIFSTEQIIRNAAIKDAGFDEGTEKFRKAIRLGSVLSNIAAIERNQFLGASMTDNEIDSVKGFVTDMTENPIVAFEKIGELGNRTLKNHNTLRRKEGLPILRATELLNDDEKLRAYNEFSSEFTQGGDFGFSDEDASELAELEALESGGNNEDLKKKAKFTGREDFIKSKEGFTAKAFHDVKQFTSGYGTKAKFEGEVIDEPEAQRRLDLAIPEIDKKIKKIITRPLNEKQKAALSSFMFNLGENIFAKESSKKLLKAINEGDEKTIREQWIQFNKINPKKGKFEVLEGLTNRRKEELELFLSTQ